MAQEKVTSAYAWLCATFGLEASLVDEMSGYELNLLRNAPQPRSAIAERMQAIVAVGADPMRLAISTVLALKEERDGKILDHSDACEQIELRYRAWAARTNNNSEQPTTEAE